MTFRNRHKTGRNMRVIVDRSTCTGCGLCPEICPEVFELDNDNLAVVKVDPVPADLEAKAKEASDSCPVNAISVEP